MITGTPTTTLSSAADAYVHTINGREVSSQYRPGLSPRVAWGGSQHGLLSGTNSLSWSSLYTLPLYATTDELIFSRPLLADVTPGATRPRSKLRDSSGTGQDAFDPRQMEFLRIFLTASSRAPELNIYNQPRVSLWPVDDPTKPNPSNDYFSAVKDTRSPLDKLMAFCSTIGGQAYYFTRNDPNDPAGDWTARNQQLYEYLYGSLSRQSPLRLPGIAGTGSFTEKFGQPVTQQQLTLIYDYLRSGVNTIDTSAQNPDGTPSSGVNRFKYSFAKPPQTNDRTRTGSGQILPFAHPNGSRGIGRFPTLQQVALMFIAQAADQPPVQVDAATRQPVAGSPVNSLHPYVQPTFTLDQRYPTTTGAGGVERTHPGLPFLTEPTEAGAYNRPNPLYQGPALGLYQTQMQAMLILRPVINFAGLPLVAEDFRIRVTGLTNLKANGASIFSSDTAELEVKTPNGLGNQNHLAPFHTMFLENNATQAIIGVPLIVGSPADQGATFSFASTGPLVITFLTADGSEVQQMDVRFPNSTFPTPKLPSFIPEDYAALSETPSNPNASPVPAEVLSLTDAKGRLVYSGTGSGNLRGNWVIPEMNVAGEYGARTADTVRSMEVDAGDTRLAAALKKIPEALFVPHKFYHSADHRAAHSLRDYEQEASLVRGATVSPLASQFETFVSLYAHPFTTLDWPGGATQWYLRIPSVEGRRTINTLFPHTTSTVNFDDPDFHAIWNQGGDFDSGLVNHAEGPFLNKPDEGANTYFSTNDVVAYGGAGVFSPNRQMPSAVMLGSLPSRLNPQDPQANQAWQTFVFSPNPNAGSAHADLQTNPPDYALLDLFWMPVVEPYAISEPVSTAGKVNMNYQIVPFSYIKRDSALRGVLRSVMITAVADKWAGYYKGLANSSNRMGDKGGPFFNTMQNSGLWGFRYPIHATETLKQFEQKFADGGVFLSESEICSLWLYPAGQPSAGAPDATKDALVNYEASGNAIKNWWYSDPGSERKSLTADNMRERPYALLYPRLTTRSNTYTVHVRAQALAPQGTQDGIYVEKPGSILSEWRGSYSIERYVDPNDPGLQDVDFAVNSETSLSPYYQIRVLNTSRFMP
jgi:uncharacterized protein (TIGR02600 family)